MYILTKTPLAKISFESYRYTWIFLYDVFDKFPMIIQNFGNK